MWGPQADAADLDQFLDLGSSPLRFEQASTHTHSSILTRESVQKTAVFVMETLAQNERGGYLT